MTAPKSSAAIVAEFEEKARAAIATLEEQRDRAKKEFTGSANLSDTTAENLFFAEGIASHFHEATKQDGTLIRNAGETDEDAVKRLRIQRRNLIRKLLFSPETPWPGFGAVRQHYRREGAKRFLADTAFVCAEGEL